MLTNVKYAAHWSITNGRSNPIKLKVRLTREDLRTIRRDVKALSKEVWAKCEHLRVNGDPCEFRGKYTYEIVKEYGFRIACSMLQFDSLASEIVTELLNDWIFENDPPNEDGESEGEYFAYGYHSHDQSDFQRLLECLVRGAFYNDGDDYRFKDF